MIYKLNIQIQISLVIGNLYSADLNNSNDNDSNNGGRKDARETEEEVDRRNEGRYVEGWSRGGGRWDREKWMVMWRRPRIGMCRKEEE